MRLLAAACVTVLHGYARAQDYMQVPDIATSDGHVFRDLFTRSRFTGLHAAIIGDSQEASPLSHGYLYLPAFNAQWATRYGTTPRTPLVQPGQSFGVTSPPAEWLVAGRMIWPFATDPSPFSSPDALPGLADWSLPAPTAGQRGWAIVLQPYATGVQFEMFDRTRRWLDDRAGVYVDVYAHKGGGPVRVLAGSIESLYPESYAQTTQTFVVDPAADLSTNAPVGRVRVGPIPCPQDGETLLQIELRGENTSLPARLVSVSLVSAVSNIGLTVSDIAAGGYTSASLLANHAGALDHMGGLGFDVAFISLGANDASGLNAAEFKDNLGRIIDALRARCGPNFPVVLLSDPPNALWSPAARSRAEFYPRVAWELASERTGVCAVNTRRLVHQEGWTLSNTGPYSFDGVHYRQAGAALKARVEVDALWSAFVCAADVGVQGGAAGADGLLDNNDFVAFIDAFFTNTSAADLGQQGGVAGSDGQFNNNDFIAFIDAFFAGC